MQLTSRKVQRGRKLELSMTSMIDVVFLLLIFFITTSNFLKTERHLETSTTVKRPNASQSSSDLEPTIVNVSRGETGFVFQVGSNELTTQVDLIALLQRIDNKLDGAFVRVSDDAPYDMAVAAIQACKSAGFEAVSYVPLAAGSPTP